MVLILYLLIFIISILIIGLFVEDFFTYKDEDKLKPTGSLTEVNNCKLHLFSKGDGNKTIVFLSGLGVPSPYCDFYNLIDKSSSFSKAIIVERAGYGFSNSSTEKKNFKSSVENLKEALIKSGHKPPYVLAPHSYGALEAIYFSQLYPNDVSSIVFIDGTSPWFTEYNPIKNTIPLRLLQFLKYTGVIRILSHIPQIACKITIPNTCEEVNKLNTQLLIKNLWNENMIQEVSSLKEISTAILDNSQNLGDIPIFILTSENQDTFTEKQKEAWFNTQRELSSWSTNSNQVIVKGANHNMLHTHEDIILIALKEATTF